MSSDPASSTERRTWRDRREGAERRALARRVTDTEGRFAFRPAVWAVVGAAVVAYLFFMALGNVRPGDAPAATVVALALGVAWLAHAWHRVIVGSRSPAGDRERRGF
jgi:hypothetical protein